jgi:hypothetical protein
MKHIYEVYHTDAPSGGPGIKTGTCGMCIAESKEEAMKKIPNDWGTARIVDKEELKKILKEQSELIEDSRKTIAVAKAFIGEIKEVLE